MAGRKALRAGTPSRSPHNPLIPLKMNAADIGLEQALSYGLEAVSGSMCCGVGPYKASVLPFNNMLGQGFSEALLKQTPSSCNVQLVKACLNENAGRTRASRDSVIQDCHLIARGVLP